MKKVLSMTAVLTLSLLSGCMGQEQSPPVAENPPSIKENDPASPSAITSPTEEAEDTKIQLFADVSKYDGTTEKAIEIDGKTYDTTFIKHDFLPIGLYVPNLVTEKKFHDGNEFQGPNHSSISLFTPDQLNLDDLVIREKLADYKEYMGSEVADGAGQVKVKYEDYFRLSITDSEFIIRLSYFEDDQDTVFPQFIDIIKNVKYTE